MTGHKIPTHRAADNPFAAGHIENLRFRSDAFDLASLLDRLEHLDWRAAIIGPQGSGKTTLLEALAAEIGSTAHLVSLPGDCCRPDPTIHQQLPRTISVSDLVLLDSAGQLGWITWRWLSRHWQRVVITSHRPGRLPTLVECHTSPRLLAELVGELTPKHASRLEPMLPGLFEQHGGDIRQCFRELYDLFARI